MNKITGTKEPIILKDEIHHATILRSTLSVDHRILDGAVAAKFLKDFNDLIEDPLLFVFLLTRQQ